MTWRALAAVLAVAAAAPAGAASHAVKGHYNANGTYVQPHQATNPNGTKADNYSTTGNVNPYTGKQGTVNPSPSPYNPYAPTRP